MTDINAVAAEFFDSCESGKGWEVCKAYCTPNATFSSQAEPLAEVNSLADYTEWMKGLLVPIPDGSYELKSWAVDSERNKVMGFAVFSGSHTGEGGPLPPTGNRVAADYVYVMDFEDGKISHMTKIWNSGWSLTELGWA